jgi:hypothetical protein
LLLISPSHLLHPLLSLGSPAFFDHRPLRHVLNFAPLRHEKEEKRIQEEDEKKRARKEETRD